MTGVQHLCIYRQVNCHLRQAMWQIVLEGLNCLTYNSVIYVLFHVYALTILHATSAKRPGITARRAEPCT